MFVINTPLTGVVTSRGQILGVRPGSLEDVVGVGVSSWSINYLSGGVTTMLNELIQGYTRLCGY